MLYSSCGVRSHYEARENKRHLLWGFSKAIHIIVNMLRSCVENCPNNAKLHQTFFICFIFYNYFLRSEKQRFRHWLQVTGGAQKCLTFCTTPR